MLSIAFVGLRMLGQGSLSLIGTQGVVMWFENRRGFALATSGTGTLVLMSMSPLIFTWLIGQFGWRQAFVVLAVGVVVVLVPIAWFGIVDRPEAIGQVPDGKLADQVGPVVRARSFTVAEAIRTPAFWTLGVLTVMAGAISTGLTFHNVDLLGERGFTESQAAAIFIPIMIGGALSSFTFGWLTDRVSARPLMFISGVALGAGAFLSTVTSPGLMAVVYGLTMGLAGGSAGANVSALLPKWFGVDHIGSIRGISSTANVAASAVGPLILSIGNDVADSYGPIVVVCAIAAASLAVVALFVPTPDPSTPATSTV
jgi:MFS family permease